MKQIHNRLTKVLVPLLVLVALTCGLGFFFRDQLTHLFGGTTTADYNYVLKRFDKQVQLVVADAETDTTRKQTFQNDNLTEWPSWTETITRFFIGRDMEVLIPVTTEFKIDLAGISKNDILIKDNSVTFKKPLTVYVNSQQSGKIKIKNQSSGLVDKAVDLATSSVKAQEFLAEKTDETVYNTSTFVLSDKKEDVIKVSEKALTSILNINSKKKIKVQLTEDDLHFKIKDKKN